MREKNISDFEGTPLEKELDEWIEQSEWNQTLMVSDSGQIARINDDQMDLFERQNDMAIWTKIVNFID